MNTTLLSLSLSSFFGRSSFITYTHNRNPSIFSLYKSQISHSISSFLTIYSSNVGTTLAKSKISYFLDTPIKINELKIYRENLKNNHSNYSPEFNLTVQEMSYSNCRSDNDGGAIYVVFKGSIYCNFTSFKQCSSGISGGAMYIIANSTNFTQACITECTSKKGSAFYIPDIYHELVFDGCSFDTNTDPNSIRTVYGVANDIKCFDTNYSLISISTIPGPFYSTNHDLYISHLSLINLTQSSTTQVEEQPNSIITLSGICLSKQINTTNIYGCNAKFGYIFLSSINQLTIEAFYFSENYVDENHQLISVQLDAESVNLFSNCIFSNSQSKVSLDSTQIKFQNSVFSSNQRTELPQVTSKGCWEHSLYKWKPPKTWALILVGVLVGAIFLAAFIFVIHHHAKLIKQREAENLNLIPDKDRQNPQQLPFENQ